MKFKTTDKEMKSTNVWAIPYCGGDALLQATRAIAYASGAHGWKYDVYYIGWGVYITTGYSPIGEILPYYKEFNKLAPNLDYEQRENLIETIAYCLYSNTKLEETWLNEYM